MMNKTAIDNKNKMRHSTRYDYIVRIDDICKESSPTTYFPSNQYILGDLT